MGPFEALVETLGENLTAGRDQVLRAVCEALTPEERVLFENVEKAWGKFEPALKRPELSDGNLWTRKGGSVVVAAARNLAFHVLRSRTPPGSLRNITKVVKPFTTLRRQPRDVRLWFERNRQNLLTLLSAKDWEPAEAGVPVGDFLVSDTTGKGGIDQIVKLVESVSEKINRSGVPNVERILYGNIFITSNLTGGLAFYRRKQDNIWIRPKTRFGPASAHSFAHELGHRYWRKVLSARVRGNWIDWDKELRNYAKGIGKGAVSSFPNVGQQLPMVVRGFGSKPPRVIRIQHLRGEQRFYITKDKYLTDKQITQFFQIRVRDNLFPTTYSWQSNDYNEHFCEAFSLRVLNKLNEPHLSKFREIVE